MLRAITEVGFLNFYYHITSRKIRGTSFSGVRETYLLSFIFDYLRTVNYLANNCTDSSCSKHYLLP